MRSVNLNALQQDESGDFNDLNFKLTVLESLYNLGMFQLADPEESDLDEDGSLREDVLDNHYGPYQPILQEYAEVQIYHDDLAAVEELVWDPGNAVFMSIAPYWDGDDELFDIRDYRTDLALLPNLRVFTAPFNDVELEKIQRENPAVDFVQL